MTAEPPSRNIGATSESAVQRPVHLAGSVLDRARYVCAFFHSRDEEEVLQAHGAGISTHPARGQHRMRAVTDIEMPRRDGVFLLHLCAKNARPFVRSRYGALRCTVTPRSISSGYGSIGSLSHHLPGVVNFSMEKWR